MNNTYLRTTLRGLLVSAVCLVSVANATLINEVGDAGSLMGSAQIVGSGTTQISGTTRGSDTEDLFGFYWAGGLFTAATDGTLSSTANFDTMLFLFDGIGTYITANDDSGGPLFYGSVISVNLTAGNYFVGISGLSNDARNAANMPFMAGATGILDNWVGSVDTGNYIIGFNAATSAIVPAPATLALLGLGLAGLGWSRRKKA